MQLYGDITSQIRELSIFHMTLCEHKETFYRTLEHVKAGGRFIKAERKMSQVR